jgi:hypothetical protein
METGFFVRFDLREKTLIFSYLTSWRLSINTFKSRNDKKEHLQNAVIGGEAIFKTEDLR